MPAPPARRRGDPDDSEAYAHRRSCDTNAVLHLHARVDDHDEKIVEILKANRDMAENIKLLTTNMGRIADVLEMVQNAKGFWATLKLVSTAAKIVLPIITLGAALWGAFRFAVWIAGFPA